jgi:DNA-binding CsgD family transcriptional regulator
MRSIVSSRKPMTLAALPEEVRLVLRNANRYLARIDTTETRHAVFCLWHYTMAKICTVDAFYVGLLGEDNTISYPYNFDSGEFTGADTAEYGPNGMCAWLVHNKRPYRYSEDGGFLLNRGQNFGDVERFSQDAVNVPLYDHLGANRRVIGLASMQSYTPGVYQDTEVFAFQWLANQITTHMDRAREDALALLELGVFATDVDPREADPVATFADGLRRLHYGLQTLRRDHLLRDVTALPERTEELERLAERLLADWIAWPTWAPHRSMDEAGSEQLIALLTEREREAVCLAVEGLTNQAIAGRMGVDLTTVKSHLANAFKKLGVRQRGELSYVLKTTLKPAPVE